MSHKVVYTCDACGQSPETEFILLTISDSKSIPYSYDVCGLCYDVIAQYIPQATRDKKVEKAIIQGPGPLHPEMKIVKNG